jgi:maltose O-acetyltransferase
MLSEREKLLSGLPYNPFDPELINLQWRAAQLTHRYNAIFCDTLEETNQQRSQLLHHLLGKLGKESMILPPFRCDYGSNIFIGDYCFINYECAILDAREVEIGDHAFIAPGVHLYTVHHPTDPTERLAGVELSTPIRIGNNVWIGGRSVICPGVTIGDNATIGAGSIVVKDIPANVVAVGNPCRVIRSV